MSHIGQYQPPEPPTAWEIIYRYLNPEVSEACPNATELKRIPPGTRIYPNEHICQTACDKINEEAERQRKTYQP